MSLDNSCHACGKSDGKLLRCGRCRGVWFCNRECQAVARKDLGYRGANCRPADGAQTPASSANARSPCAVPSRPPTLMDMANLEARYDELFEEGDQAAMANTRVGYLAAVAKAKEAAAVADLIGGAGGASWRAQADLFLSDCLFRLGEKAAAASAACSSLRTARALGNISALVRSMCACGDVAREAPDEMVKAERAHREQGRRSGSAPSYGGLDLSQEGHIRLPTTPAALSRLCITYMEAAIKICDAALAGAGGRGSPAAADELRVPSLGLEAELRPHLGLSLVNLGEEPQRGLELVRQAVVLMRQGVRRAEPGLDVLGAKRALAVTLCNLWVVLAESDGMAEVETCLREALELGEETDNVELKQNVLRNLSNLSGRPDQPVGPAEAAALRSRLNALCAQAGRNHDTSCTICLEPLEQPDDPAEQDSTDEGGLTADGFTNSSVLVLSCTHQFHRGCLSAWWRTRSDGACPLCKKLVIRFKG